MIKSFILIIIKIIANNGRLKKTNTIHCGDLPER